MSVRALEASDVTPLSLALSRLPLMQRYKRSESAIAGDLVAAMGRGEQLAVDDTGKGPKGLVWFSTTGTFLMGGYLRLLAVEPEATGGGIGARLLEHFEQMVRKDSRHAFLLVSDFNTGAQRFYERYGYAQVGRIPRLLLPDVDELLYWKRLR